MIDYQGRLDTEEKDWLGCQKLGSPKNGSFQAYSVDTMSEGA